MVRGLASFVFLSAVLLYALPSLIAVLRPSRQWPLVVALNILLGWTIVGWSAAFMISDQVVVTATRKGFPNRLRSDSILARGGSCS